MSSMTTTVKPVKRERTVPPDGGWGYWIVVAYIITGVTIIPIIQNFGLIFKTRLIDIGLTSTDITTIISMNSSIGQILGVFQSPLLKRFGFRIMATIGVTFFTVGTLLTGFSYSFTSFIVFYGIITSIGFTYTLTSFSIAINSYFKEKRSRISGWLMGFTGLGPVFMPQIVTLSLGTYGTVSTSFILAGLTAQSFIGVCLLQPVERHMLYPKEENEEEDEEGEHDFQKIPSIILEVESIAPHEPTRQRSLSVSSRSRLGRSISESEDPQERKIDVFLSSEEEQPLRHLEYTPSHSLDGGDEVYVGMKSTIDLMNQMPVFPFASVETLAISHCSVDNLNARIDKSVRIAEIADVSHEEPVKKKKTRWQKYAKWFNKQFDFDLLRDPIYISILLGLSIAVIGELMFSILTPFILYEVGLNLQDAAMFMSIVAIADIASRFISPYIAEGIKIKSPRVMYLIALFFLFVTRASLLFVTSKKALWFVAVTVGFAKGVRTVFWGLVIPHHVPMAKLGSAMSFQNLLNGILIFFAGPISGAIVEINNSYLNIIYVSNVMTAATILLWVGEWMVIAILARNRKNITSEPTSEN